MNTVLWILQSLLALAFLAAGGMKLSQPKERLETTMGWVADVSAPMVRFIGTVEVLGALGLILPAATGIATVLTPLAAVGLGLVMVGAAVTHARRSEPQQIVVNVVLLAIAVVIAWGRFGSWSF
ncbi:DoxX family protein [Cellulomonas sp. P24]|uniref:DoxX family protein n=1 Tax=Cellulomonas sp. P24 TaxID=2885206 RepID=UPI00216B1FD8|nr:DoxX family protein [Cellulomonas sp. P24]MCR6493666.1 DoxX family protein [Cellulomonas sp. P24]